MMILAFFIRGIWTVGTSLMGAAVKATRIKSKNLISVIFCEATAIYGVIMALILAGKIAPLDNPVGGFPQGFNYPLLYWAGYCMFWSGLGVGLSNLASG